MKKIAYLPWCAALFAVCVFLTSTSGFAQEEKQDGGSAGQPTEENFHGTDVHVCPRGWAMAGAHVGNNRFLCLHVTSAGHEGEVETYLDDIPTQGTVGGVTMHVCRSGWYMRGLHDGNNWLVCSRNIPLSESFLDPWHGQGPTQGYGMHVCPISHERRTVMTGIHNNSNQFSCANIQ
jgi:hypothetical protein